MQEQKDLVHMLEYESTLPGGQEERFNGYGVYGHSLRVGRPPSRPDGHTGGHRSIAGTGHRSDGRSIDSLGANQPAPDCFLHHDHRRGWINILVTEPEKRGVEHLRSTNGLNLRLRSSKRSNKSSDNYKRQDNLLNRVKFEKCIEDAYVKHHNGILN